MKAIRRIVIAASLCVLSLANLLGTSAALAPAGGQHDFDFNIGTWHTEISLLAHPLSASTTWRKLHGTVVVRKVWNGRASVEEVEADGDGGHFESLALFLYDPKTQLWSENFANSKVGTLGVPTVGSFKNGLGKFYDRESFDGRPVVVRQIWSHITPNSHQFEQAFSADGGRTWETNFIANLTRIAASPKAVATHVYEFRIPERAQREVQAKVSGRHLSLGHTASARG
jgi:hypothetical protein